MGRFLKTSPSVHDAGCSDLTMIDELRYMVMLSSVSVSTIVSRGMYTEQCPARAEGDLEEGATRSSVVPLLIL